MTYQTHPSQTGFRNSKPSNSRASLFGHGASGSSAPWLVVLGLAATLIGRTLAPALPGSRSGIGVWIAATDRLGAVLSQMCVVYGLGLATWLTLLTLRAHQLRAWYKISCVLLVAFVIMLNASAIAEPLHPWWAAWLGSASALLACFAAPQLLKGAETRAVGMVLAAIGLAALVEVTARWFGLRASDEGLVTRFKLVRAVVTFSFALKAISLVLGALWLGAGRSRHGMVVTAILLATLGMIRWGAMRASLTDAPWWQIMAARVLAGLVRQPTPLVVAAGSALLEIALVAVSAASMLARRSPRPLLATVALALLSRGAADIPLCALMLTVAALVAPLAIARGLRAQQAIA